MPTGGGGGGGGGLSSVTTDSSLTGNGTAGSPLGLLLVSTQPRLTGAGIASSKLDIAGLPLTYFQNTDDSGTFALFTANKVFIAGIVIPYTVTFSKVGIDIKVGDATNNYDIGLYTQAGSLVANIGPTHLPSTGLLAFSTLQGSQTFAPGLYLFAGTCDVSVAQFGYDTAGICWVQNNTVANSSSGTLPNTIPAQTTATPAVHPQFMFMA